MADSQYLGTIQIWRNLNEHCYYLTLTKYVICQIDPNCSRFQSLNMLPFHMRLERLKLTYYCLISNLSVYYFKAFPLFLYIHMYLPLYNLMVIILVSYFKK